MTQSPLDLPLTLESIKNDYHVDDECTYIGTYQGCGATFLPPAPATAKIMWLQVAPASALAGYFS